MSVATCSFTGAEFEDGSEGVTGRHGEGLAFAALDSLDASKTSASKGCDFCSQPTGPFAENPSHEVQICAACIDFVGDVAAKAQQA